MTAHPIRNRQDLLASGWSECPDGGFMETVGPFWQRLGDDGAACGFFSEAKHRNRSGVVQGGMLATLADRALGLTARMKRLERRQSTIQLGIQFIEPAPLGVFVMATGRLLRETGTVAFLEGRLEADGRLIGHASAVFRIRREG